MGCNCKICAALLTILSVSHMSTNSGCGKREEHIDWFMVVPEKAAPVIGTTLRTTGPVLADSRQ